MTDIRQNNPYRGIIGQSGPSGQVSGRLFAGGFVFLIPCLTFVEFDIVGRLFLTEIVLLAILPFLLLLRGSHIFRRLPLTFILLGLLWLMSQVVTDLIRNTPFVDYSRGWAKIGMTLVDFIALYLLIDNNRRRLVLTITGLGVGMFLVYAFNPNPYLLSDPWKFGLGIAVAHFVSVAVQYRGFRDVWLLPAALFVSFAVLSFILGTRSLAGIGFMAGIYTAFAQLLARRRMAGVAVSNIKVIFVGLITMGAAMVVMQIYVYAAGEGMLGYDAQEKYFQQSEASEGLLLGGRTELFASSQAILDSPIIGHGSWAKDNRYVDMILAIRPEMIGLLDSGLIPTHSFIFGAWVEAGIMGAIFWGWVFILILKVMAKLFLIREPISHMFAFIGFLMIWDILFSPFGAERRFIVPVYIVFAMFLRERIDDHSRSERAQHSPQMDRNVGSSRGAGW